MTVDFWPPCYLKMLTNLLISKLVINRFSHNWNTQDLVTKGSVALPKPKACGKPSTSAAVLGILERIQGKAFDFAFDPLSFRLNRSSTSISVLPLEAGDGLWPSGGPAPSITWNSCGLLSSLVLAPRRLGSFSSCLKFWFSLTSLVLPSWSCLRDNAAAAVWWDVYSFFSKFPKMS